MVPYNRPNEPLHDQDQKAADGIRCRRGYGVRTLKRTRDHSEEDSNDSEKHQGKRDDRPLCNYHGDREELQTDRHCKQRTNGEAI